MNNTDFGEHGRACAHGRRSDRRTSQKVSPLSSPSEVGDKRQLCPACNAVRLATMKAAGDRHDAAARGANPLTTVASLMVGSSGRGGCGGDDMCHAQSAFSARANLDTLIKRVMKAEDFLHPRRAQTGPVSLRERMTDLPN